MLSVMYEPSTAKVVVSLTECLEDGTIRTGATAIKLDEFLGMSSEDFENDVVNGIYAYGMQDAE